MTTPTEDARQALDKLHRFSFGAVGEIERTDIAGLVTIISDALIEPPADDDREALSVFDASITTRMNEYLSSASGNPQRALRLAVHDVLRRQVSHPEPDKRVDTSPEPVKNGPDSLHVLPPHSEPEEWEYGVMHTSRPGIHRGPWDARKARLWIQDWLADGGKADAFYLVRRPTGPWLPVPDDE